MHVTCTCVYLAHAVTCICDASVTCVHVHVCVYLDVSDQSDSEDEEDGAKASGHDNPLAAMQLKLKELTTAYDLMVKNNHQLSKLASELENAPSSKGASPAAKPAETFALMKLTCSAVVKVTKV